MKKKVIKLILSGVGIALIPAIVTVPLIISNNQNMSNLNKISNFEIGKNITYKEKISKNSKIISNNLNEISEQEKSKIKADIIQKINSNIENNLNLNVIDVNKNIDSSVRWNKEETNEIKMRVLSEIKNNIDLFMSGSKTFEDFMSIIDKNGYSYKQQEENYISFKENNKHNESEYKTVNLTYLNKDININRSYRANFANVNVHHALHKFQEAGIQAGIMAGAAAAIAAGYFVVSFFTGGATFSSGVAASIQATLFAVEGLAYGAFYESEKNSPSYKRVEYDYFLSKTGNYYYGAFTTAKIGYHLLNWLYNVKKFVDAITIASRAIQAGVSSTSWAAPTGLAFLFLADATLSLAAAMYSYM
ncbi:hypothetical protein EI74_0341 [Mycoplasma testudineum]|uniref:Uncharacterized protein n=1 Tax=Mycoplasma testudineum TaxID=244584 RepID=A0A4R6IFN4_9MOLU|nr:hypothetical protein [Mycoplasma testudineum]OYD26961.1 hypothetical protein CG473_01325 [Mycoplasma testudineum]TDO20508.1 hypothetical protein EI74_0341 [Mycoplasma testudineum]